MEITVCLAFSSAVVLSLNLDRTNFDGLNVNIDSRRRDDFD